MDGIDKADGLRGKVLLIGFGRFAQVVEPGPAGAQHRTFR